MHKKKAFDKKMYYAKILFAFSSVLLIYGLILDLNSEHRLIDPIKDVVPVDKEENNNNIHVDTDTDVVVYDGTKSTGNESNKNNNPSTNNTTNNNNGNSNVKENTTNNGGNTTQTNRSQTVEEKNNILREQIQNTYSITVKYGDEINNYLISENIKTVPITNAVTVNNQLIRLKNTLALYPNGLFREIKNGGIPLTILLINNFSDNEITGVTDSTYSYANIYIAASHPFEVTFYHESYHYIERYMFKKNAFYSNWTNYNYPSNFKEWGVSDRALSYEDTKDPNVPFVNQYAQSDEAEDRASTFEYMMSNNRYSCFNSDTLIKKKAKYMAQNMEAALYSVSPTVTEHWERYL